MCATIQRQRSRSLSRNTATHPPKHHAAADGADISEQRASRRDVPVHARCVLACGDTGSCWLNPRSQYTTTNQDAQSAAPRRHLECMLVRQRPGGKQAPRRDVRFGSIQTCRHDDDGQRACASKSVLLCRGRNTHGCGGCTQSQRPAVQGPAALPLHHPQSK